MDMGFGGGFGGQRGPRPSQMVSDFKVNSEQDNVKLNIGEIPNFDDIFAENRSENSNKKNKNKGLFRKIMKNNVPALILCLFIYLFQVAPVFIVPIVTANIINIITKVVQIGGTITNELQNELIINLIIMFASIFVNVPVTMLRFRIASKSLRKTSAGIRSSVVRKLQTLSFTYYSKMENGRIQSKYLKDTESVDGLFTSIFNNLSLAIISAIISICISVYKNGTVSLFFLFVIPFNIAVAVAFRKKIGKGFREYRFKTEIMSVKINTMVEMLPVTKSHGLENYELANVDKSIKNLASSGLKVDRNVAKFGSTMWMVNSLLSAVNLAFCCFLALKGSISVGEIVLFGSMFSQISGNVTNIVSSIPMLGSGLDALNSISEIMNVDEVELNLGKGVDGKIEGNIKFDDVCFAYPDCVDNTINNFSLEVKKGECIAVVGASGCGKTTLMNMIIGFLQPTSGALYIDGNNISQLDLVKYRNNISVVPQNSILFSGAIRENITYGIENYSEDLLNQVIEKANINEFVKDLPNGIDTRIGEHGAKLSGGQKQRITIARALVREPKILILDEATSALDNISEYHVQKAISSSIDGKTTFIVAHRLSTIRNADRIVVMEKGKCVEIGTYDELMEKKGKFFELKKLSDIKTKNVEKELGIVE